MRVVVLKWFVMGETVYEYVIVIVGVRGYFILVGLSLVEYVFFNSGKKLYVGFLKLYILP